MVFKKPAFLRIESSIDEKPISYCADAVASISVQPVSGDFKLVSESFQEYNFTKQGLCRRAQQRPSSAGRLYQISDEDIEILEPIGEGASATVYKARYKSDGREVAIKCIDCLEKEKRKQIMNDIRGLCDVSHPSLVQFLGAFRKSKSSQISIVLEYVNGGSLADLVKKAGRVPEVVLSEVTAQVLKGLIYLHKTRHTVHRDIKPANILLNSGGQVKIADFGISAFVDNTLAVCNTFLGTVTYMSPERINSKPYSFSADIWSFGVTLLECALGKYPYDASAGPLVLMMQVLEEGSPVPKGANLSPDLHNFLEQCLRKDPYMRPTAEQLLSHPFIKKHRGSNLELQTFMSSLGCTKGKDESDKSAEKDEDTSKYEEAEELVDRLFSSLSAGGKALDAFSNSFSEHAALLHEGVRSQGRKNIVRHLHSICNLQMALGANKMIIDTKDVQRAQDGGILVHGMGHIEMSDIGPLGSALWDNNQTSCFACAIEMSQQAGQLGISTLVFRHV